MTNYNVNLTPKFINLASEGGLDGSILNGKSYQRTFNMYEVENGGNRKMINSVKDDGEFNDTTFQDSTGEKTFELNLVFNADQILDASDGYDENGFVGVGAVISITPEQAITLNSYGYPALVFDVVWADGSYLTSSKLLIFTPDDNFENFAVLVPEDNEGYAVCDSGAIWNMPVAVINFVIGGTIG